MKSYNFSFRMYQSKLKSLPGFLAFFIVLLFIILIPLIFAVILVGGIGFMIVSGIIGIFLPNKKSKDLENAEVIEIKDFSKLN